MDVNQARESLLFADNARHRARRDVGLSWLPVLLYVAFAVVAIAVPGFGGQGKFLWLMAAPVVAGLAALYANRHGRDHGIVSRPLAWVVIPFGLLATAFALGALAFWAEQPAIAQVLPPLVVAAGYLVFARIERNLVIAAAGVAVLLATVGMVIFRGTDMSQAVLALVYVVALLGARLGQRSPAPSRP